MVGGYTYYWSGRSDGYHTQGVAVAVSTMLTPRIIEETLVNECIMRLRIYHSLGVVSLVSGYVSAGVMDLRWLVHGFSTHRLIAGLGIPTLVIWQRRVTMCSLMVAGG